MPISAPPNRGYTDMQRVQNWDSPVLYGHTAASTPSPEQTPVLDVSRYAYLGGIDLTSDLNTTNTVIWYADPAGSTEVAARTFQMTPNITQWAQYRMPNLGPYVFFEWQSFTGANFDHQVQLFGTNRFHPCELIPYQPVVIDQQATAIAANATQTIYPTDYFAGPVSTYVNGGPGVTFFMDFLSTTNTWDTITEFTVAALVNQTTVIVAPFGAWRCRVKNNTSSASAYSLTVTPSLTGSS